MCWEKSNNCCTVLGGTLVWCCICRPHEHIYFVCEQCMSMKMMKVSLRGVKTALCNNIIGLYIYGKEQHISVTVACALISFPVISVVNYWLSVCSSVVKVSNRWSCWTLPNSRFIWTAYYFTISWMQFNWWSVCSSCAALWPHWLSRYTGVVEWGRWNTTKWESLQKSKHFILLHIFFC